MGNVHRSAARKKKTAGKPIRNDKFSTNHMSRENVDARSCRRRDNNGDISFKRYRKQAIQPQNLKKRCQLFSRGHTFYSVKKKKEKQDARKQTGRFRQEREQGEICPKQGYQAEK